jgi:hypothetical protein
MTDFKPPSLRELAEDPVYRKYLRTPPKLPEALRWGYPWRLWVELPNRWLTKKYHTYPEAWNKAVQALRHSETVDVCIVSMRHFFDPPIAETKRLRNRNTKQVFTREVYWLPDPPYEWCFRCRRPSLFVSLPANHHALRTQPVVSPESPYRCFYCGIRRVGMPSAKHYNFHGVGSTAP